MALLSRAVLRISLGRAPGAALRRPCSAALLCRVPRRAALFSTLPSGGAEEADNTIKIGRDPNQPSASKKSHAISSSSSLHVHEDAPYAVQRVTAMKRHTDVVWHDGHESKFFNMWLRDHCSCPECTHPVSQQRMVDSAAIPLDARPLSADLSPATQPQHPEAEQVLRVVWTSSTGGEDKHNHCSEYSLRWLRDSCYQDVERRRRERQKPFKPVLWAGADMRSENRARLMASAVVDADTLLDDHREGQRKAVRSLLTHGIVQLTGVGTTLEDVARIAPCFGVVRRTFYADALWDTAPKADAEVNDTAYTNLELRPHTDGCYFSDPPGLQLFVCAQAAGEGGYTWLVDGFKVAQVMAKTHPDSFKFFCRVPFTYKALEHGVSALASGPVFTTDAQGNVTKFRFNDYDRDTLKDTDPESVEQFYEQHLPIITSIIRDPKMAVKVRLDPGDCIIVDNHRVMHGRTAFEGLRNLMGCYYDHDELANTARVIGVL